MTKNDQYLSERLCNEIGATAQQVQAAIELLDSGATVPFIARYRKEKTQGLDDTQLRTLEEKLIYFRELDERRESILKSIESQDKLTDILKEQIQAVLTKQALEDLYLPYRPKRTTKGQLAIDAGLLGLADGLWENPAQSPQTLAADYICEEKKITNTEQALTGARAILMERFSEDPTLVAQLRDWMRTEGYIFSKVKSGKEKEASKFKDYFEFQEKISKIPAHRALAIFRGKRAKMLDVNIDVAPIDSDAASATHPAITRIHKHWGWQHQSRAADDWLSQVFDFTWKVKLNTKIQNEILSEIKEAADRESIQVFSTNLKHLLMSAPAGQKVTMGLDPGLRTGVKVAIADQTGHLVAHDNIFPHAPKHQWDEAINTLKTLCEKHQVELISIGDGTASRETEQLVNELKKKHPELKLQSLVVSEAGASVYSASEEAAKEFPELDVSYRGAVSIARRLQDPLAELVKIDPKSIGVGQYQHDVNQVLMSRSLDAVVEDCVNAVGVDVNTASAALLARISGLDTLIAGNLVNFRNKQGPFKDRNALKQVPRFGKRTFELAAGFLRVRGENPLDQSGVHPEAYGVVERISKKLQRSLDTLISNPACLEQVDPSEFTTDTFGEATVKDILNELEKPGRDPRPEFKTVEFKSDVNTLNDLKPGMILPGIISNVTNFGAFVNIGVHQDGLVHVSALADRFVKNPHECVKAGDIVQVKVTEVDIEQKRISLTMRLDDPSSKGSEKRPAPEKQQGQLKSKRKPSTDRQKSAKVTKETRQPKTAGKPALPPGKTGTFADLFANALETKQK